MDILYLPIIEPGANHATALLNKRGLYNALVKQGHQVIQLDYLARNRANLYSEVEFLIETFAPDIVLTQLHGADIFTPAQVVSLRMTRPEALWLNWSGDSHRHSLLGEPMVKLMRHFDMLLVPTLDVLPDLEAAGIQAAYWNIAYEEPVRPLPQMPHYDIVFQGNVFNDERRALVEMLRSLPYKVGIYGDWEHADGNTAYDFAAQRALYQNARLAIADNYRPDDLNYVSDRPMQIMASGGALCLHQFVETMYELTGWEAGIHYIAWRNLEDLKTLIYFWMQESEWDKDRSRIIKTAKEQVERRHSFDARVQELFQVFLPEIRMRMTEYPTG